MKSLWLASWYALAFVFLVQIMVTSWFSGKVWIEILIGWILLFLPLATSLILETKREFHLSPIFGEGRLMLSVVLIAIFWAVLYKLDIDFGQLLLILFALSAVVFGLDSRISFALALGFLSFCPLLLLVGYQQQAELLAVYAYYFLAFGVALELVSMIFRKNQPHEIQN